MIEVDDITIKTAAKGNIKAFKKIYDHYSSFIWKVIFRTVNGDSNSAEQIMQDVFIKIHKVLKSFKFNSAFSTWLYRITYNVSLTFIAKQNRERQRTVQFDDSIGNNKDGEIYENRETVEKILELITPVERFLLVAREVNSVPFEELAGITGQTSGSLRTQLYRIKEKIRKGFNYG